MTQCEQLISVFKEHENVATLGDILKSPVGYEWRARATELRRRGYRIELVFSDRKYPSHNTYRLLEPMKVEADGQQVFA
jgi:hypothetical protein